MLDDADHGLASFRSARARTPRGFAPALMSSSSSALPADGDSVTARRGTWSAMRKELG
jgi:hypothetical protein